MKYSVVTLLFALVACSSTQNIPSDPGGATATNQNPAQSATLAGLAQEVKTLEKEVAELKGNSLRSHAQEVFTNNGSFLFQNTNSTGCNNNTGNGVVMYWANNTQGSIAQVDCGGNIYSLGDQTKEDIFYQLGGGCAPNEPQGCFLDIGNDNGYVYTVGADNTSYYGYVGITADYKTTLGGHPCDTLEVAFSEANNGSQNGADPKLCIDRSGNLYITGSIYQNQTVTHKNLVRLPRRYFTPRSKVR